MMLRGVYGCPSSFLISVVKKQSQDESRSRSWRIIYYQGTFSPDVAYSAPNAKIRKTRKDHKVAFLVFSGIFPFCASSTSSCVLKQNLFSCFNFNESFLFAGGLELITTKVL